MYSAKIYQGTVTPKQKMNNVASRLEKILATLPTGVQLVAVSKFHSVEAIKEAYTAGQRIFGESRAQELKEKYAELPDDIQWHFIGHLQTNKVRMIMPYVALFQSVDTLKLLSTISAEASRIGKTAHILLQIDVAREETKFGFSKNELYEAISSGAFSNMPNISVDGIMGMASNSDNNDFVRSEFETLSQIYNDISSKKIFQNFKILSMGMSHDYRLAISCGSNMVRIGTDIFGEREY